VIRLVDEYQDGGYHDIRWDGTDQHGTPVGSGVYFYRLRAGSFVESKRMLLLK